MSFHNRIKQVCCRLFPITMTKYFYRKILGRKLDLKNPTTFNEKINWYKLYYCPNNPLVIKCADKYQVRDYIRDKGCEECLNDLIGVWDTVDDIDWDMLPNRFALKCNHGCGMNIICENKRSFSVDDAKYKLKKWMAFDWGKEAIEPHYSKISRKIICEKFIDNSLDNSGILPPDVKVHCFSGEPQIIAYYSGRASDLHGSFYDTKWNKLEMATKEGIDIEKPECLDEILEYSRILSEDFPYVRVDFYVSNNKPIFGELTFDPASGRSPYMTYEADCYMGSLFDLCEAGFHD